MLELIRRILFLVLVELQGLGLQARLLEGVLSREMECYLQVFVLVRPCLQQLEQQRIWEGLGSSFLLGSYVSQSSCQEMRPKDILHLNPRCI